ncbi:MAG: hypothetical protein GY898_02415 [Proteobacteria bacterium]|nr:hypothetical protein [Pseudomonadota bacterium]
MSDLAVRTEVALHPLLPEWGLVLGVVLAIVVLAASWRGSAGVRPGKRRLLLGLRLLALLLLAVVIAGPERVTTEGRAVRDPFVVLIDASRSMQVQDGGGTTRAGAVGRWLQEHAADLDALRDEYDVKVFGVSETLDPWSFGPQGDGASGAPPGGRDSAAAAGGGLGSGEPTASDGAGTDLGQALFGLSEALGGSRPAGALLISDGADRAALGRADASGGPEAVGRLVEGLPFPVSTWTVGDPDGPADLAVRRASAPPFGFVRRPLTIEADLSTRALPAGPTRVTLHADGELVAVRDVSLAADSEQTVSFEVKPEAVGFHTWRVTVPVPPGDTIPANNVHEVTVKVVRDRTRILQVTSRPSWDVKFLRRLLKTDPNIDLVSFFILRQRRGFRGNLADREELSLIAFPYEDLFSDDLQGFDLVIFQNFWFGTWSPISDGPFMENVARYVEDGGAFLMIGGDVSFGEAGYGESPLARVLPTDVPTVVAEHEGWTPVLTEAGQRHPVTRLDRDDAGNAERWAALPSLQGRNLLGPLKGGGVALMTAGEGGEPVAAVRSVGKGRTMAFATDTSWKWAMSGAQAHEHADFWRGAVRWLVKDAEQRQVQVITDKENYRLGESIQVQIRVLGADHAPRPEASISGSIVALSGDAPPIPIAGTTDHDGQYGFILPASREGTLSIEVDVAEIPDPFGFAEARVSVTDREGELEHPRVRPDMMAAIAEATGGKAFKAAPDPREAPRKAADSLLATDRTVEALWSHPLLLLLLVLPLGAEWVLRRRLGLR